jgi:NADH dehydrogenase
MILVAGGSGFIGSAAVRRLVAQGAEVAVMTAHPERSRPTIERLGAALVEGDVQRPKTLERAVRGAEALIQALTFPTFPVEKPGKGFTFEQFDHLGTERLVAAAAGAGVRKYVYASGVGAAPDAPQTWYRAKWRGEEAIRASGIDHAIVRPSWVYGPGDIALNKFVAFARWSPIVPVVGDGTQRVQPVLVDDVGAILAQAAGPSGPGGTFEIGGPDVFTMNEVIRTMLAVMGKRRPVVHFPDWMPKAAGFFLQALPRPPLSPDAVEFATADAVADTRRLREEFDVRLTPLAEGLATYLAVMG